MIPTKRFLIPVVSLTVMLLVACEPLAPEQYVVVTGVSPEATTELVALAGTPTVVHTPEPTPTPRPTWTPMPTVTPFACSQSGGTMIRTSFNSEISGNPVDYRVYLPPCFGETLRRYPYVILLHGTSYDDAMWEDLGIVDVLDENILAGTLPPMVVVMPDGAFRPDQLPLSEEQYLPPSQSYEAVVVTELIPLIESVSQGYCLWTSRDGRAIGGISRGGFWSFSIAFRHPDMFSAVGGHSPYFDDDNAAPETNPLVLADRVNLRQFPLRIFMDAADSDIVKANASALAQILMDRGVPDPLLVKPTGNHDEDYWSAHLLEYLTFYGEAWPLDVLDLPSCLEPSP